MSQLTPKELIQNKIGTVDAALWPSLEQESWKYNKIDQFYSQKFGLMDEAEHSGLSDSALDELTTQAEAVASYLCSSPKCVHLFMYAGYFDQDFNAPAIRRLAQLGINIKESMQLTTPAYSDSEKRMQFINQLLTHKSMCFEVNAKNDAEVIVQVIHLAPTEGSIAQFINFDFELAVGAKLQFIESHVSAGANHEWRNVQASATLKKDAQLIYVIDQQLNGASYCFHSLELNCKENTFAQVLTHAQGAQLSRFDLTANVSENAKAQLFGLSHIRDQQKAYHNTKVIHEKPLGESEQLYKAVLDHKSQMAFAGKIRIEKDAQKVNSKQYTKSLLLSTDAESDAKPSLEIFADDVKANHGATVGQLDDAQVFYLQSRGISRDRAQSLVAKAFFAEVIEKLNSSDLKAFATRVMSLDPQEGRNG